MASSTQFGWGETGCCSAINISQWHQIKVNAYKPMLIPLYILIHSFLLEK